MLYYDVFFWLKNSSSGYDNIDSKLLICTHEYIVKPLRHIFSLSLEKEIVPHELHSQDYSDL